MQATELTTIGQGPPGPYRADPEGFAFEPGRWYDEAELLLSGGIFTTGILKRARDKGELRCREVSRGKRTYKGEWLLAWLEGKGGERQVQS